MGLFDFFKTKSNKNLNFVFKSPDHLRYEHGRHVSGPHGGANRAVKVEPNINGGEGCTVTMYNLDGSHPVWQNNVQMAPKQMKVVEETDDKIVLRGYGRDSTGASFSDYGLTVHYQNGEPNKCVLHMHDRGVDIEYLPPHNSPSNTASTAAKAQVHVNKKTLLVASQLIDMLIENCDDEDAYASQSRLRSEVEEIHNFTPTFEELNNAVLLINTVFPAHNDIIKERMTGNMLNPVVYVSSYELSSLRHVQNGINKALAK